MPAKFVVRSIQPKIGVLQIHLSLDLGQPNDILLNVTPHVASLIFGEEVREGDVRAVQATLVSRAGTNGRKP